ncbi:MAG: hypothetical protein ACM31D_10235 [Bacteroidota bacterium]
MTRTIIVAIVLSFVAGAGAGAIVSIAGSIQTTTTEKDRQIAALTVVLNELRSQLAAEQLVRTDQERRAKAFNKLTTNIAPPQTFEIGK